MKDKRTIPFGRPWISDDDRAAVLKVLDGHVLTHGPQCKSFEEEFGEFLGPTAHATTVSSCMAALHLAYLNFGIGPGEEVIVPAQTHTATVHAVEWVGARPVFVDCDPATGNMTPELISAAITSRTRAIGLVHFVGIPCNMPAIMEIALHHDLKVIEDCAIALGSRYDGKHVGLFGHAGCFSFYPVKHITTGEGGMLVSNDPDVVGSVTKIRGFGVDRTYAERAIPGYYDVPLLGLNYRMSEMHAALGRSQLSRIEENLAIRRSNFQRLKRQLDCISGIRVLDVQDEVASSSHYCLSVVLSDPWASMRNKIVSRLNAAGIGTSIYYPQPVPRMTYYRNKYGYCAEAFPQATAISDHSIALPVGPHVGSEDIEYISEVFADVIGDIE